MTHPARNDKDYQYPHVETLRSAMAPATDDAHWNEILKQRNDAETRTTVTIIQAFLGSPQGQAVIREIAASVLDPETIDRRLRHTAERITRETIAQVPVPPHEHQAQDVVLTSRIPGFSRLGAIIGAAIGGLLAWLLVMSYSVTTIAVNQPNAAYTTDLIWVKTAIVIVVVLFFAMIGGLVGPKRKMTEQLTNVNIRLKRTHMHQGRVPSYDDIAATASRASRGDNQ